MSWLLLAFVAPLLWAAVALIDTYFVHGVYAEPLDGAGISGLFQSSPWLLVPLGLIEFRAPGLLSAAYRAQLAHPLRKSLALALIASGIYAIT